MDQPNEDRPWDESPEQAAEFQKSHPTGNEKKSSSSCCLYGCLFAFLLVVVLVVGGGFSIYWWVQGQVARYTSDTPADLPTVELPEEELAEVQDRIDEFKTTIEAGDTPDNLVLTAEEINALITKDEELRGKVYVTIKDGEVAGEVSIPTDFLPGGEGRFFNASATFDVSLENGVLIVTLADAEVKGEKLPPQFIEAMSQENLAKDAYKDPEVAATLRRIESISIEQDKIILKPRVPDQPASGENAAAGNDGTAATDQPQSDGETSNAAEAAPASTPGDPPNTDDAPSSEPPPAE